MGLARLFVALLIAMTGLSAFQVPQKQAGNSMDSINQQIVEKFAEFETKQDPTLLYELLNSIEAAEADIPVADLTAWNLAVSRRLQFFAALDRSIDPAWNSKDVPAHGVPAPAHHGMVYGSGEVDPESISDLDLRAQYVQAVKANKEAQRRYFVQLQLRSIDERAMLFVERLLTDKYADSNRGSQVFEQLLAASPVSEIRKERLREVMAKSK